MWEIWQLPLEECQGIKQRRGEDSTHLRERKGWARCRVISRRARSRTAKKLLWRMGGGKEERRGRWAFLSCCDGLIICTEGNCSYFHAELQAGDFQKPNSSKQKWSCLRLNSYLSHTEWFITMKNKKAINCKNFVTFDFLGMELLKNSTRDV